MIFTIQNRYTGEVVGIAGYNYMDACQKANIDANAWFIIEQDFIYD